MSDIDELKKSYDKKKSALDSKKRELKSLQSTSWSGADVFSRYDDAKNSYDNAIYGVRDAKYALSIASKSDISYASSRLRDAESILRAKDSDLSRAKSEVDKQESRIRKCKSDVRRLASDLSSLQDKLGYEESNELDLDDDNTGGSSGGSNISFLSGFVLKMTYLSIWGVAAFYLKYKFIEAWNNTGGNWIPIGLIGLLVLPFGVGLFKGAMKCSNYILEKMFFALLLLSFFFVYFELYKFIEL